MKYGYKPDGTKIEPGEWYYILPVGERQLLTDEFFNCQGKWESNEIGNDGWPIEPHSPTHLTDAQLSAEFTRWLQANYYKSNEVNFDTAKHFYKLGVGGGK